MDTKIGQRVIITDGSSDGHTGVIVRVNSKTSVRVRRDADGVEVDVSNFTPMGLRLMCRIHGDEG